MKLWDKCPGDIIWTGVANVNTKIRKNATFFLWREKRTEEDAVSFAALPIAKEGLFVIHWGNSKFAGRKESRHAEKGLY